MEQAGPTDRRRQRPVTFRRRRRHAYLLYAGGIPKGSATKISRLNDDGTKVVDGPHWIEYGGEKRAPEGPHLVKKDGWYYHTMAASGGIYDGHHQLIARSRNVLGPYEPSPHNPFIAQMDPANPIQHHGHAKLVQTQHGEWWAFYLCQRRLDGFSTLGRETGLDRVDWGDDGWPVLNGGKGPSNANRSPNLPATPVENQRSDDFSAAKPGSSGSGHATRTRRSIVLPSAPASCACAAARHRLTPGAVATSSCNARSATATRQPHDLEFRPRPGDEAGLVCYYDGKSHVTLGVANQNGVRLRVRACRKGENTMVADVPLDAQDGTVELRVDVDHLHRVFSCRTTDGEWRQIAAIPDTTFLSDEGTPLWGFTGTMVGVYATRPEGSSPFAADFDFFHLK